MRKTPVVLGILALIFGGLSALFGGISLLLQTVFRPAQGLLFNMMKMAPQRPGQPDMTKFIDQMQELMKQLAHYTTAFLSVRVLLALVLVVVGIGLVKRAPQARRGALIWSAAALAFTVAEVIFQLVVVQPKVQAVMATMANQMPAGTGAMMEQMQSMAGTAGVIVGALFKAAFPIVLIVLLGRKSAENDFAAR